MSTIMPAKARDVRIDIVKAIGIILMVFYHAGTPGKDFVYLFHMALFFLCSGYCYSHKSETNPKGYILRKIKTLYIPSFVSGFIVACLQNIFLDIHIYSYDVYNKLDFPGWLKQIIKCFAFGGGHQMIGANWFFRTLFLSSVLYMFLNLLIKRIVKDASRIRIIRFSICLILTSIGGLLGQKIIYGKYFNFLTVMILIDIGLLAKELDVLKLLDSAAKKYTCSAISVLGLLLLNQFGEISINSNIIMNPLYFILCSVFGFVLVYTIADSLSNMRIKDWLVYVGQSSIWIMFFHYVGFKLVTLIEIIVLGEPIANLSAYPTHHTEYGMWSIYGVFGVLIPLLIVVGVKWTGNRVKKYVKLHR